jgi:hypothetical protein
MATEWAGQTNQPIHATKAPPVKKAKISPYQFRDFPALVVGDPGTLAVWTEDFLGMERSPYINSGSTRIAIRLYQTCILG